MTDTPAKRFQGTADGGAARTAPGGGTQLAESDLKTMTAEEIVKAREQGRCDQLLGRN